MSARPRNPAVVLNPGAGAGVGLVHSLALGDVPIATISRRWPPILGRFSRVPCLRGSYQPGGKTMVEGLLELADRFDGRGILFPGTDLDLETLMLARRRLEERYVIPENPAIGDKIFEKNWQYGIAETVDVPTPLHCFFNGGDTPDVGHYRFPLIVKPSTRGATAGDWVFRLRIVQNHDELAALLQEITRDHPGREFQVAENIPGEPDHLYTVGAYANADGKVLRTYTGRKLSQFPYHHGVASLAESVPLPDDVVAGAVRLLEAMRFFGISQVEYKLDVRDGLYKLIEVNGRSWLWIKLAAFSGVNLPLIQYYDLTGDPRLGAAIAAAQRYDRFYMHDLHVYLNDNPVEQKRLREVGAEKECVRANQQAGDTLLNLVYGAGVVMRRVRAAISPTSVLGAQWVRSRSADKVREAVRSAGTES